MREARVLNGKGDGPSMSIWHDCPWEELRSGTRRGWAFHDDFTNVPDLMDTQALDHISSHSYPAFIGASATITGSADKPFGEIVLATPATDDIEATISMAAPTGGGAAFIDPTLGVPHSVWFEAMVKTDQIASGGFFVGFVEAAAAILGAAGVIGTGDLLADRNLIGFRQLAGAPTLLGFAYKRAGQTVQVPITTLATLVADTYVKVGFKYNPFWPADHQIAVYLAGVKNATKVTRANITAVTFPDADSLSLTASVMASTTTIKKLTMDWWRAALLEN